MAHNDNNAAVLGFGLRILGCVVSYYTLGNDFWTAKGDLCDLSRPKVFLMNQIYAIGKTNEMNSRDWMPEKPSPITYH